MSAQKGLLSISGLIILTLVTIIFISLFLIKDFQSETQVNPTATKTQLSSKNSLKFDFTASQQDPFNDPNGPFYHQVFLASSPDGLNFTKEDDVLFDKASVPDIIRLPNGRIFAYMVDGAKRSKSGILVALSDDDGKSWDLGSLQIKSKSGFAGTDPEAILLNDGTIRLFYIVFGAKNKVLSAASTDGVNFNQDEGIRFEYPKITDPDISIINDKWFMYLSQGPKLIAATSDDGLTFKLKNTVREIGSVSNTVYVDVDFWRQFYCFEGKIKSAKTKDGLTFQDEPGFMLEPQSGKTICDPAPVHLGGSWLMLYKVSNH